jgi:hypothetical protein
MGYSGTIIFPGHHTGRMVNYIMRIFIHLVILERIRWAEHVTCMRETRENLVGKSQGIDVLGYEIVVKNKTLKIS